MGSDSTLVILKPTVKRGQTASVFVTTLRDLECIGKHDLVCTGNVIYLGKLAL